MTDINKYRDFLTQKDLLTRGWTKQEIDSVLVKPDFVMSYRGSSFSYTCHLYDIETVARMERTNHMDLGDELINTRRNYVFWEDLYEQGWTQKQLKTLLPSPRLIRNWNGRTAQATYKAWDKNDIAHELAFAVSKDELAKNLARRKKMGETKKANEIANQKAALEADALMKKYKSTPLINFNPKYQPQHQNDAKFVKAIADNNADEIFIFFNDSNRVGVISNRYREEIIKVAEELGFPTNIESKNYKRHWKFSTSEARELFVIEVIDYLAVTYGIVNEPEALEEVLQEI